MRSRVIATLIAASAIFGGAAESASAAPGDLSFAGCIGALATSCTPIAPDGALSGADAVAVSGDNLYAAATTGDAISHFKILAGGGLVFQGCIGTNAGPPPCTGTTPTGALIAVRSLTISGSHMYAAANGVVAHLTIQPGGGLVFANGDCVGNLMDCTATTPATALAQASDVAVSGQNLYVSGLESDAISEFSIQGGGSVNFDGCIGTLAGCTPTNPPGPTNALDGASDLAISGSNLYAASHDADAVSHFTFPPSGGLTFQGCIGDNAGPPACTATPPATTALDGARGLAVRGQDLYAAASGAGAISEFSILGGGGLNFDGCTGNEAGCTPTDVTFALQGVHRLATNGSDLYSSAAVHAISRLAIAPSGGLFFANCTGQLAPCPQTNPTDAISTPGRLAVAGPNLYVPNFTTDNISHFRIEQPPAPPSGDGGTAPIAASPPGPTGQRAAALKRCKKKKGKARKKCRKRALKLPV